MSEISKTVDLALRVLLALGENGPATPASLARDLAVNRSVAHRILTTLHRRGFVVRRDNRYVLGGTLVQLARRADPDVRAVASVAMSTLFEASGETVVMHVPDGGDAVVVEQLVANHHVVRVEHPIGSRHPIHRGASGRALLALLGPDAISRVLKDLPDGEKVDAELRQVRALGYAVSYDELQDGVHGIAVPILDPHGAVVASLAILVPASRTSTLAAHLNELFAAAAQVRAALGGPESEQPDGQATDPARRLPEQAGESQPASLNASASPA